jgi:hypothetical protein
MAREPCDGCGRSVQIAGGIANFWTLEKDTTDGLTLELADGGEYFLCYECIELLPEDRDVTSEDVEDLPERA